jgi:hypothetical protein
MTGLGYTVNKESKDGGVRLIEEITIQHVSLDRCPTCHQLLVTCLGCGRHRGAWKDPTSRSDYCSARCRATAKKRRHRGRNLTQT